MNWLMIVISASSITFAKPADDEALCHRFGAFYTNGIEHAVRYECISAPSFLLTREP